MQTVPDDGHRPIQRGTTVGVSVSASAAVVAAGLFIALTTGYPAAANGFDRVAEGTADSHERALDRHHTAITVETATFNASGNDVLTVTVVNDGADALVVDDLTLLADNTFVDLSADPAWTTVEGLETTTLVLPGETLTMSVPDDAVTADLAGTTRVTVATGTGVRAVTEVSG